MSTTPCFCSTKVHDRFVGDSPRGIVGLVETSHNAQFPDVWQLHCSVCGGQWRVSLIPYGGIYGDFDWERLPAPVQGDNSGN